MEKFLAALEVEHEYAKKWGTDFDSKNTPNDWVAYIAKYLGQAVTMPWDAGKFKAQLVKVANLAATAYENCDKVEGSMPKRHYD